MTQKTAGNHHYPGLDPASPKYRDLVENLVAEYRPLAKTLCHAVLRTLNKSEESLQGQSGKFLLLLDTQPVQTMRAMNLHSFIWYWPNSRRHPVS
jgi:hypothetical protein